MSASSISAVTGASLGIPVSGVRNPKTGPTNSLIIECLKTICPQKPWAPLMDFLGLKYGTAKHRLEGDRKFSTDELAQLLQSEDGYSFLVAVMADAKPTWWRVCRPLMEVAETQKMQAMARRRLRRVIEGAVDADREISATIQRAETALCVQDEDFYRPQFDGARASSRTLDRAVATPAKRK